MGEYIFKLHSKVGVFRLNMRIMPKTLFDIMLTAFTVITLHIKFGIYFAISYSDLIIEYTNNNTVIVPILPKHKHRHLKQK